MVSQYPISNQSPTLKTNFYIIILYKYDMQNWNTRRSVKYFGPGVTRVTKQYIPIFPIFFHPKEFLDHFRPVCPQILIIGYWPEVIVVFVVDVDVPNVDVVKDVVVCRYVIFIESMYFSKIMKASFYGIPIQYTYSEQSSIPRWNLDKLFCFIYETHAFEFSELVLLGFHWFKTLQ